MRLFQSVHSANHGPVLQLVYINSCPLVLLVLFCDDTIRHLPSALLGFCCLCIYCQAMAAAKIVYFCSWIVADINRFIYRFSFRFAMDFCMDLLLLFSLFFCYLIWVRGIHLAKMPCAWCSRRQQQNKKKNEKKKKKQSTVTGNEFAFAISGSHCWLYMPCSAVLSPFFTLSCSAHR